MVDMGIEKEEIGLNYAINSARNILNLDYFRCGYVKCGDCIFRRITDNLKGSYEGCLKGLLSDRARRFLVREGLME